MLYPVIDIGSNTVKIAVLDQDRLFHSAPAFFKAVPLNIRAKVCDNLLPENTVEELCRLICEFSQIAKRLTPTPPIAFATASLRGLDNAGKIVDRIAKESGILVDIISGEKEAYYSFLGAKGTFRIKSGISVDLGGGSTELVAFRKNEVVESVSLPFGCLTLYHRFFADGNYDPMGCEALIRSHLRESAPKFSGSTILLSGGSAKAVLRYKNFLENKNNYSLGTHQMKRIARHFVSGKPEEKKTMEGMLKDRYRLIPPALCVFRQIAEHYEKEQSFVCRCGVREGCLAHFLKKK